MKITFLRSRVIALGLGGIVAFFGILANGTEPPSPTVPVQPLLLHLEAARPYYNSAGPMYVRAHFTAISPVTVCLYPSKPEAQFKLEIYRGGYGQMTLPNPTVQLTAQENRSQKRVALNSGEHHTMLFDIKKLYPLPKAMWQPGEYRIQGKFYLCGQQNASQETVIPSTGPLHILVLD